jgi:hypothetical protein
MVDSQVDGVLLLWALAEIIAKEEVVILWKYWKK